MLQREEAAQPCDRLLSRRPEPWERMHPAELPGPAGAVSISCVASAGSLRCASSGQVRWYVSVSGPQLGADWEVWLAAYKLHRFCAQFGAIALGRWKYVPMGALRAEQGGVV